MCKHSDPVVVTITIATAAIAAIAIAAAAAAVAFTVANREHGAPHQPYPQPCCEVVWVREQLGFAAAADCPGVSNQCVR